MNKLEVYVKTEIGEVLLGTVAEVCQGEDCQPELKQLLIDVVGDIIGKVSVDFRDDFSSQITIELREPTGF